jgi:hypothetical protein
MPSLKLTDVTKAASLLKKVVDRADVLKDGALSREEIRYLGQEAKGVTKNPATLAALQGAHGFGRATGPQPLADVKRSIDDLKARVRAADKDGDGVLSEAEQRKLKTAGERSLLGFVGVAKNHQVSDFAMPAPPPEHRPRFKWSGTPAEVAQSLLAAFSVRSNDNHWPTWGTPYEKRGMSARYVIDAAEAKEMVQTLKNLYPARQKSVLTELAGRTAQSGFGCAAVTPKAKPLFDAYAKSLGVSSLKFRNPAAPTMPAP